jgi:hypothetical protein
VAFVADDIGAWLVGRLADSGGQRLITWVLGSEQERALRRAGTAAVQPKRTSCARKVANGLRSWRWWSARSSAKHWQAHWPGPRRYTRASNLAGRAGDDQRTDRGSPAGAAGAGAGLPCPVAAGAGPQARTRPLQGSY